MKRVLFIGHEFHRKTRSSDFFKELLRDRFEVEEAFVDPDDETEPRFNDRDIDAVVLWQIDYLAPIFIARGLPTIVIPMYDGSSGMPDEHWRAMSGASIVAFSLALYSKVSRLGARTHLVKYFPEPADRSSIPSFEALRAFFWERTPKLGLDEIFVAKLIDERFASLHVHKAADGGGNYPEASFQASTEITRSSWFNGRDEYEDELFKSNVFLAPRLSEGIGLSLLEAMARGQLVIANDDSTHNEYIANWHNGILINLSLDSLPPFTFADAAAIGLSAWQSVVDGRAQWLASIPGLLDFIEATPAGEPKPRLYSIVRREVHRAYARGAFNYRRWLDRNIQFLDSTEREMINDDSLFSRPFRAQEILDGIIDLKGGAAAPYMGDGWSASEEDGCWIDGHKAELIFLVAEQHWTEVQLEFRMNDAFNDKASLALLLNDVLIGVAHVEPGWKSLTFRIEPTLIERRNVLVFHVDRAESTRSDGRLLSLAVRQVSFGVTDAGVDADS